MLSNAIRGTKESVISKMGFFATRIFPILSEFSFSEYSWNMGQHGKDSNMHNSSLPLLVSSLVLRQ